MKGKRLKSLAIKTVLAKSKENYQLWRSDLSPYSPP